MSTRSWKRGGGTTAEHVPVLVIGAGFGGIGLGVKLRQAGIEDFVILERTGDLGGTWSRNTYPGAACDVPSTLYCFASDPNPAWSRKYATQPEILAYLREVAERHGVVSHIRLDTEVVSASYDEDASRWQVSTNLGELTADVLVSAVGAFAEAAIPDTPGLASFQGTMFHSLHWDHEHDLRGERVGVIGTGASAVQIIPAIQPQVANLSVFQRTPPWIVPRNDRAVTTVERAAFGHLPLTQRLARGFWYLGIESFGLPGFVDARFRHPFELLGRFQLRRQVKDPVLRAKLTPDYMIGCKRAIFSDEYYPALTRPNVEVVTHRIVEVTPTGVVTSDGRRHPLDTILLATGFATLPRLNEVIKGIDGRTMAEVYRERPQSYLGAAMAGFPNFLSILGPFGAAGNQSAVFMIEGQIDYIVDALQQVRRDGIRRFDLRPEVQDAFVEEMHAGAGRGTWLTGGCSSYYTNGAGLNSGLYPSWSWSYRRRTKRWDAESYDLVLDREEVTV
ncbi:MAG TPA: NAD(P)/FAD-dependent oxidoreductase [Nocardioides sp.]|nr:NAD(P)/FAD-dependent oxidoreductase [Nocardioides sp.]